MRDHPQNAPDAEGRFFRYGRQLDGSYRIPDASLPRLVPIVGDGQIGGKARGLLFVLREMESGNVVPEYQHLVHLPRSTVLTTRVFDDFMESNDLRDDVQAGCRLEIDLGELRERILAARFPDEWKSELVRLLNLHRGPLVVRSSSVMEDDVNHSFAGIYLSEFLANRGSDATRLERLIEAVKAVYASTFGPNARAYRKRQNSDGALLNSRAQTVCLDRGSYKGIAKSMG